MIETLIVPGLNGSPAGHWQNHWAEQDRSAELVGQEDFVHPVLADWLYTLEARIEASAPGVILVAHSLGCSLVAALAGRPAASHVGGALLVAPADLGALSDSHPSVRTFAGSAEAELPFASILVASRNDLFMSFSGAERQATAWGSALYDLGEAGHINIASGFGPWVDAHTLADGLRGRVSHAPASPPRSLSWWASVHLQAAPAHDTGLGIH